MLSTTASADVEHSRATRFFWAMLIVSTCFSVGGNVTHAVLHASTPSAPVAAAVATVPPLVLLWSLHGVSLLVRAHRHAGLMFWCALLMTLTLAGFAFILSFDALRSLAVTFGVSPRLGWLWPLAVDVSIANATVALLSLSRPGAPADTPVHVATTGPHSSGAGEFVDAEVVDARPDGRDVTPSDGLKAIAAVLVSNGTTEQSEETVAEVLARRDAGAKPTAIANQLDLHHSTVNRILNGHHRLTRMRDPGQLVG
jgi:hypothetical protein